MKETGKTLTIIPAKAASTRLKKKNLLMLCGKPLIAYTIAAAKESGVCGEIVVSTESHEIAETAKGYGASVPFLRPEYLAHDPYQVDDVCINVLKQYEEMGKTFSTLIILLPTSPFCTGKDIAACAQMFADNNGKFLMSVSKMDPHYYDSMILDPKSKTMKILFDYKEYSNCEIHPIPVRANGAVTIVDVNAFKAAGTYYGEPLIGFEMPPKSSIDSLQPYYGKKYRYKKGKCPNAEKYYAGCLSLPMYPAMKDADIEYVIQKVVKSL